MDNKPRMMLNSLPTIIDAPGEYLTRGGRKVLIHRVVENPDPLTTLFGAKGSILRPRREPEYGIWHVSGRYLPLSESSKDIVAKA